MDEDFIRDLFATEGPITLRRMFGGHGIYLDGLIVALDFGDGLLLKADTQTIPLFEAAGGVRWRYRRDGGTPIAMPYCSLPDEALDDPEAMAVWAKRAREAAMRAGTSLKKRRSKNRGQKLMAEG